MRAALVVAGTICALLCTTPAAAQTGANVLVVINSASAASDTIGRQYAAKRAVPQDNLCIIQAPVSESVAYDVYASEIEGPIWTCIATRRAHDRILYILLTKDVPIRVSGTASRAGTNASVDSELTLLYRRRTGQAVPVAGFVPNPYFAGTAPVAGIRPFTHESHDIYLVTRLDGYTTQDALALIDRAATAGNDGRFVFYARSASAEIGGDRWLRLAAERLRKQGLDDQVTLASSETSTKESRVLGYYSWGSNDPAIRARHFDVQFAPGAIAGMFVSTDGRTFKEPPATWRPSVDSGVESLFGGSRDSLMGDLIREGVTGAAGYVNEPFLDATIRPDILFPAYASGRNLAEAYYAAMPYLSWQTLIVGDPLCAPFPRSPVEAGQIDPSLDAATELPAYFARRQLAAMPPALSKAAAAAFMLFDSRSLRNDAIGARQALEAAVAAEPRFIPARLRLAAIDDRAGNRDEAMAQYRAILSYSPNDPVALNNLAYALAVHKKNPEEALPLAERAVSFAGKPPAAFGGARDLVSYYMMGSYNADVMVTSSLDTLAWVLHLLGRDVDAADTIRQARDAGGQDPDILWHAAVIYSAVDRRSDAAAELNSALAADPMMANRVEIQQLSKQLAAFGKQPQK